MTNHDLMVWAGSHAINGGAICITPSKMRGWAVAYFNDEEASRNFMALLDRGYSDLHNIEYVDRIDRVACKFAVAYHPAED